MKLVIQVPAWNEADNLPRTLGELPRRVAGFDVVETVVVDDGSTDATGEAAAAAGARVVRLPIHRGLARAFNVGLDAALAGGADVIVNTDADGQYDPEAIPRLVAPILAGDADIVLGDRGVATLAHFSPAKRWLQRLGASVVRLLSGVPLADATTGFRAFSRAAAARLGCYTTFTYTLETLIQAGQAGLAVVSVPVGTRAASRPSRLFRSNLAYVTISLATLVRLVFIYRPLRILLSLGALCWVGAAALGARFAYYFLTGLSPAGHVQSLIAAAVLGLTGVQLAVLGVLADLTAVNRRLLDELRARERERK
ncbi:MAG: glycosyltransferase family 2 protein [Thermoanaerobaculaceae bacterium]|nr:glycosyltransferase family 2 protein [Thermoanaerobaculaceae bacterium]TAM51677.1 MAG: glycosyltransferase [Acidobacteriota bacterium]